MTRGQIESAVFYSSTEPQALTNLIIEIATAAGITVTE